jgi:hypothetical protein
MGFKEEKRSHINGEDKNGRADDSSEKLTSNSLIFF